MHSNSCEYVMRMFSSVVAVVEMEIDIGCINLSKVHKLEKLEWLTHLVTDITFSIHFDINEVPICIQLNF